MRRILLLTLVLLFAGLMIVSGQDSTANLHLIVDRDVSLTIFISSTEPVSLAGLSFRVVNSLGTFQTFKLEEGFNSLRLTDGIAPPGSCFVYTQSGTSPVLSSTCSAKKGVFRVEVPRSDVFWYDFTTNRQRDVAIVTNDVSTGNICTSAVVDCPFIYNAPAIDLQITDEPQLTLNVYQYVVVQTQLDTLVRQPLT